MISDKITHLNTGIPISVSLNSSLDSDLPQLKASYDKKRLAIISALAVLVAACISIIARLLIYLIDLFTNISFYGNFSFAPASPVHSTFGAGIILVPVAGGLIVGLMALYGSRAIRGHGIPEAMEQILTNQSRIKPSIMYLKPLSAAISIGTGGPFGAEGPIIATGGALGSTIGQLLKITHHERKILLAAGATAGMSAIFGSPIAAIFLAIELLLFEFSPRSFIPVSLACITGAAGHHFLFNAGYVFEMKSVLPVSSNSALFAYSIIGLTIGLLSVLATKIVYLIEDAFEKLPVHWALWPAIGGLVVGIIGFFSPRTLGVGYENITDVLSGNLPLQILLSLSLMKFLSWAIALGSGTSGGTLAPLLTIGGASGALLGSLLMHFFPSAGVIIPLAALVGMSAMFAGASRAFLTSIIFALETTGQSNALLPLLATCTTSYFVSFFLMENTIMTEKIARRGIKTPHSYEPDNLGKINAGETAENDGVIISNENTIHEVREWLNTTARHPNYFIVADKDGEYRGILSSSNLNSSHHDASALIETLIRRKNIYIRESDNLRSAVEIMATENIDVLPVISDNDKTVTGILSHQDIIATFRHGADEHVKKEPHISLKKQGLKMLITGKRLVSAIKPR